METNNMVDATENDFEKYINLDDDNEKLNNDTSVSENVPLDL